MEIDPHEFFFFFFRGAGSSYRERRNYKTSDLSFSTVCVYVFMWEMKREEVEVGREGGGKGGTQIITSNSGIRSWKKLSDKNNVATITMMSSQRHNTTSQQWRAGMGSQSQPPVLAAAHECLSTVTTKKFLLLSPLPPFHLPPAVHPSAQTVLFVNNARPSRCRQSYRSWCTLLCWRLAWIRRSRCLTTLSC